VFTIGIDPHKGSQPSIGRQSVRSRANPMIGRQGILETTDRHPKPYEHIRTRSHDHHHSGQSVLAGPSLT